VRTCRRLDRRCRGRVEEPIYPFDVAVERVKAAVAAAQALSFLHADGAGGNYLNGRPDLPDTIRRLQAFAEVGADVLYAPGLRTAEQIDAVVKAVAPKPVNVVMGLSGADFSVADLAALGVKRISVGSAMARAAYGAFLRAAREVAERGTFTLPAMPCRLRRSTRS
jgi:2-methylisocitrate lyase-like PEP mutase family enzyme